MVVPRSEAPSCALRFQPTDRAKDTSGAKLRITWLRFINKDGSTSTAFFRAEVMFSFLVCRVSYLTQLDLHLISLNDRAVREEDVNMSQDRALASTWDNSRLLEQLWGPRHNGFNTNCVVLSVYKYSYST